MSEENNIEKVDQNTEQSGEKAAEKAQETTSEKVEEKKDEKVFKQEDVNNIVAKESKKATEKLIKELGIDDFENAKDGLAKFKEWQESQKTEAEKQAEKMQTIESNNTNLESENTSLKAQISAMKNGVTSDSVEDVVALAERLVNDDVDIDQAIKQVVEKYPHFAEQEEEKPNSPTILSKGNPNGGKNTDNDPFARHLARIKNQ